MRHIAVPFLAAVFLLPAVLGHSGSHGEVSDPGKVPGDMLYGLELFTEDIKLFFASGPEEKVELKLEFADKRLMESAALMESGKVNLSEQTFDKYLKTVEEAESIAESSRDQSLTEKVENFRDEREQVVNVVKENLPGQSSEETVDKEIDNQSGTGSFMATGRAIN